MANAHEASVIYLITIGKHIAQASSFVENDGARLGEGNHEFRKARVAISVGKNGLNGREQ
jgi:hypothetical protein